jgi:predicted DNA-binding transcriptional regulator YafY
MPQPERRPGGPQPPEAALPRYHQAARFAGEALAEVIYFAAQNAVLAHAGDVDRSAYRFFQLNRVDHVVIVGEPTPADIHDELRSVLAAGAPAIVPEDILRLLIARRTAATQVGSWVEGHYRPGKQLP